MASLSLQEPFSLRYEHFKFPGQPTVGSSHLRRLAGRIREAGIKKVHIHHHYRGFESVHIQKHHSGTCLLNNMTRKDEITIVVSECKVWE